MAAPVGSVRIRGLREVQSAFRRLGVEVGPELKKGLKEAAEPVAAAARGMIGRYPGASTSTIKPYSSTKGAVVRQSASKRGGKHPQFGALQMGHLLASLEQEEPAVIRAVENLMDDLTREEGF